jgi:hypothetical protein
MGVSNIQAAMTTPVFNLEKSLQVVLYVANRLRRKDFHKIFKIIYFADREHLSESYVTHVSEQIALP